MSLNTIRYDWVQCSSSTRPAFPVKKKRTVDNEIIDGTTTNANFLKILFSAFAQKNGEQNAVTDSATYKN